MNHENIDYSSYKIVFSYDFLYISIFGVKVDLRVELPTCKKKKDRKGIKYRKMKLKK